MLRLSTRLVIKVVLMPTLTDNVRSEALVEAVHSEVVSLETQWSRGMLRTTPPAHAAKVAAVALGTHVRDPQVCRAWRNVSRGSWLPTVDPQHALRCWAVMEAAGESQNRSWHWMSGLQMLIGIRHNATLMRSSGILAMSCCAAPKPW